MSAFQDLTGQHFGLLTVLERAENRGKDGRAAWLCQCACGATKAILGSSLKRGHTQSCGCLQKAVTRSLAEDLAGQEFGRLTVVEKVGHIGKRIAWRCTCSCGEARTVTTESLKSGHIRSCGCLKREVTSAHFLKDLVGQTFGRLTVQRKAENQGGRVFWFCRCECGKEDFVVLAGSLTSGNTKSCGCLYAEREGPSNPNWRGGVTAEDISIRSSAAYHEWRLQVYRQHNYTCQHCGVRRNLHAHHIKAFVTHPGLRLDVANGLTLCEECHQEVHRGTAA